MPTREEQVAFPTLTPEQIDRLRPYGAAEPAESGQVLFEEGQKGFDFFLVLEGTVEITERSEGTENRVALHEAGEFTGDVDMLTGRVSLVTATVEEAGEVLRLPADRLREIIAALPEVSDLILQAFLTRRALLLEQGFTGLQIVGSRFSPDAARLREFAARNQLPYTWLDLEEDAGAEALLEQFGIEPQETPVTIWRGEHVLKNPSNAKLAGLAGLSAGVASDDVRDLVVVGAGPAGLAAAVYGASEGLSTLCVEAEATGGQASTSSRIENYFGFPAGLSGAELTERARLQAQKFGARVAVPRQAVALRQEDGAHVVMLGGGEEVAGRSVLIATGARYRKLRLERLEDFEGAGVYYAATKTEATLCKGAAVVIVGGGNSAGQAAVFLAQHARCVYLLIRGEDLAKGMSRYLVDRVRHDERIEVLAQTEVTRLEGDGSLRAVVVRNNATGEERPIDARALFIFIGAEPHTGWLSESVALDANGFVVTGKTLQQAAQNGWPQPGRAPYFLETAAPGVFAAGDVRSESIKRVASAVGEGSMAVKLIHQYLSG